MTEVIRGLKIVIWVCTREVGRGSKAQVNNQLQGGHSNPASSHHSDGDYFPSVLFLTDCNFSLSQLCIVIKKMQSVYVCACARVCLTSSTFFISSY